MSRVLIMAGGTGGHVMPGLAVAKVLRQRGLDVSWLGTAQGIESTLVPAQDIELELINSHGLRGRGLVAVLSAPFMLFRSLFQAMRVLRRLRPAVVLGMGGYAAGPGGLAAWLMRYPLVLHEQNSVVGLTNRLLRPLARAMLFGFPGLVKRSNRREQFVGNPVSINPASHTPVADNKDCPTPGLIAARNQTKLNILVLGGSQGARALNQTVAKFGAGGYAKQSCNIWHQCGKRLTAETDLLIDELKITDDYRLDGFIEDMAAAYQWADLVVARAGALTISELCAAAKPSILVPLPSAAGDHQTTNANLLVGHHAAILLPQYNLNPDNLQSAISSLESAEKRQMMAIAANKLARPGAAELVADICLEVCDA